MKTLDQTLMDQRVEQLEDEIERLMHDCQNFLNEIERLREALAELYAADLAPRDANHGREWQNALRKAEAALRKPEEPK